MTSATDQPSAVFTRLTSTRDEVLHLALRRLGERWPVAVRESLLADPQPDAVLAYAQRAPYDAEVVERALEQLGTGHHPARALLRPRLAAASRD